MGKEATLKIGNSFVDNKSAMEAVAKAITDIFDSAKNNGIEQSTIVSALHTLGQITKVENVSVSNSTFKGDKTLNISMDDDEFEEPNQ